MQGECKGGAREGLALLMRMEVPTPSTRVRISGFGWPIGQNNPGQDQNYFPLNVLAQKCSFLTLKSLFLVPVREGRLTPSPVFLFLFLEVLRV